MRRGTAGSLLLAAGIVFAGCLGSNDEPEPEPQEPTDLTGRTFFSTSITEDGEPRRLTAETEIRLSFEGPDVHPSIGWRGACNVYGADVEMSETTLTTGTIAGTEAGCPVPALAEHDAWVADFFEADPAWRLTDDELTLTSGESEIQFAADRPTEVKRLEAVRRSPLGLGREPPSDREVALAERIMAANAFLGRIAEDGGGYRIRDIGLIHAAGPDRILGLTAIVRFEQPVDGIYELPVTCNGVSGPPFALPATPFNFDGVSLLVVDVSFADRRIASISPHNGDWRPEPGAAYLSVPSTCERRTQRDIGY